jgi:adenine-specific DNA-methyltransferase
MAVITADKRKDLGAFFTPPVIARAMARWAIRAPGDLVLEPAAGEAAFLIAAAQRLRELGSADPGGQVTGVEIDARAREEAQSVTAEHGFESRIVLSDFFAVGAKELGTLFDVCIGNPPYVRYHRFRGEARELGLSVASSSGVELSGLASSWAHFVVHAAEMVAPGGRLAFVLPAELLHVDYAEPVREFLRRRFGSVTVVTFDEAVFPGAMIDTVLLLAEDGPKRGLRVVTLRNADQLHLESEDAFTADARQRWSSLRVPGDGGAALAHLAKQGRLAPLSSAASVDIGFVTGANEFFVLTLEEARRRRLPRRSLHPVIARPGQMRGAIVSKADVATLVDTERALLLRLSKPGLERADTPVGRYLRRGRRTGVARAYKCRVRDPWYAVPGVRVPHAFLSYMSARAPRVALNVAGLSSTNLVHQLTFDVMSHAWSDAYVAAMHSSISHLSFEIEGRSYGGGVLKHETREAERVLVPVLGTDLARALAECLPDVDAAIRAKDEAGATEIVDVALVRAGVVDTNELVQIKETTESLRARRTLRGKTKT